MTSKTSTSGRMGLAWARTKFDLEGIGGAVAGLLVGILLGWIWGPLFWIGGVLAILILFATRSEMRVTPELANIVVAPCDGVVHSVTRAIPPVELRLGGGEWLRLRIASSPFSTNPLYASITGEISSLIEEEPDASRIVASRADDDGLAMAHVSFESLGKKLGYVAVTGGLGPRLDMNAEAGDPVRAGRVIGKRRLGGWCDVYLDGGSKLLVSAGQTLIGAETVLCRLDASLTPAASDDAQTSGDVSPTPENLEDIGENTDEDPSPLEDLGDDVEVDTADTETTTDAPETAVDEVDDPDDVVAALFKKLKQNEQSE